MSEDVEDLPILGNRLRVVHTLRSLPRSFSSHPRARRCGIIAESDLRITRRAQLRAKLLVFDGQRDMRLFWRKVLGKGDLGKGCEGVVSQLGETVVNYAHGESSAFWRCDPRYFCVIGLCREHLTTAVISHESVHVGFAYLARTSPTRSWWAPAVRYNKEEALAYPTGLAAHAIVRALRSAELVP